MLHRGVNIHHMLNWPRHQRGQAIEYVWPPFGDLAYATGPDTLSALRRAGFTFIRLTLDPAIFMASDEERRRSLTAIALSRMRELLGAGFEVILDLHPVAENPAFAPARLMAPGFQGFSAYIDTVGRLAAALQTLPRDRVALELMNEPQLDGPDSAIRWRHMLEGLHAAARSAAPDLALVLSGQNWSGFRELTLVDVAPFRGSNVFYTFHYYEPHIFTHQGVSKTTPERYFDGLLWPPQISQKGQMATQLHQKIFADPTLDAAQRTETAARAERSLSRYMDVDDAPGAVARDFATVARWAKANGITPQRVLLGEFGANQLWPETPAGHRSRIDWLTTIRKAAEANGFGWAYWALKDVSGSAGGFKLLLDGASAQFDGDVLRALLD